MDVAKQDNYTWSAKRVEISPAYGHVTTQMELAPPAPEDVGRGKIAVLRVRTPVGDSVVVRGVALSPQQVRGLRDELERYLFQSRDG